MKNPNAKPILLQSDELNLPLLRLLLTQYIVIVEQLGNSHITYELHQPTPNKLTKS